MHPLVKYSQVYQILTGYLVLTTAAANNGTREQNLWSDLLNKYGEKTRPHTEDWEAKTTVYLDYQPIKFLDINQRQQTITVAAGLTLLWDDARLTWDNKTTHKQRYSYLPIERIWYPRVAHYKSIDSNYQLGEVHEHSVWVHYKGHVKWVSGETFTSSCAFDVTYFPFDSQKCYQYIRPWPLPSLLDLKVTSVDRYIRHRMSDYSVDNEWKLEDFTLEERVLPPQTLILKDDSEILVTFHLKRKPAYYVNTILVPTTMFSFLVLVVFTIPVESGEKLSFGVTLLLTFSVFRLTLESELPKTSTSTPLLSSTILFLQILTAASILITIFILNLHHLAPILGSRMSKPLRCFFFTILTRLTLYTSVLKKLPKPTISEQADPKKGVYMCNGLSKPHVASKPRQQKDSTSSDGLDDLAAVSEEFRKIMSYVERKSKTLTDEEERENANIEWRLAATVIERLLLMISTTVVVGVQVALYVRLIFHKNLG